MIKFEISKKTDGFAEEHYQVVGSVLRTRIGNILGGRIGSDENPITVSATVRGYLNNLLVGDNLKNLICARPDQLRQIAFSTRGIYPTFALKTNDDHKVLYNLFIKSIYDKAVFGKLDFIKRIDCDTCAYCNRNYIYYLSGNDRRPIKPQIDHFLPKAKYPYLGLSFYNLIPSCATCNSTDAKGEIDPTVRMFLSPYEIEHENTFTFTYKAEDEGIMSPTVRRNAITVSLKYQAEDNNDIFKLEKLYQQHSDHVLELIIKSKGKYAQAYRKYLASYKEFKFDDLEIDRMILGNYAGKKEIHKRPLAKLYQDIGKELNLIKKDGA